MSIGKQIRHYRNKLGWKLETLSIKSGVDIGTISALETRDSKRSQHFNAIAQALGLTVEELADESKDFPVSNTPGAPPQILREPPASYGWPFSQDVTREDWDLLSSDEKELIERSIITLLRARDPTKHHSPAINHKRA